MLNMCAKLITFSSSSSCGNKFRSSSSSSNNNNITSHLYHHHHQPFNRLKFILILSLFLSSLFSIYIDLSNYAILNACAAHPVFAAETSGISGDSVTCHGPLHAIRYQYVYEADLAIDAVDRDARAHPIGFAIDCRVTFENIWQDKESYLAEISVDEVRLKPRADAPHGKFNAAPSIEPAWPPLLAAIDGAHGRIRSLYVDKRHDAHSSGHRLEPTHLNLVVSLLNALRSRFDDPKTLENGHLRIDGRTITRRSHSVETTSTRSLLAPKIEDHWEIVSHLAADHDTPQSVTGWQNVSIESKIYSNANSHLRTQFKLDLRSDTKSPTGISAKLSASTSLSEAIKLYPAVANNPVADHQAAAMMMIPIPVHFIAERKSCEPHYCEPRLASFVGNYSTQLSESKSLARSAISVGYLRLLNFFRINSRSIEREDVSRLLSKLAARREKDGNILITLLDAIAGARHGEAMLAALKYLDLPKCSETMVDACERFLAATAIASATAANMGSSHIAEHSLSAAQLFDLFLPLTSVSGGDHRRTSAWADDRVKHAYALTLGTILHSYRESIRNIETASAKKSSSNFENGSSSGGGHSFADTLVAAHSSPLFVDVTQDDESNIHHQPNYHHHMEKLILDSGESTNSAQDVELVRQKRRNRVANAAEKVLKYLIHELEACDDADCRVGYLHAIGNARQLSKQGVLMHVLRKHIFSGARRESVAAMRALRDCVEYEFDGAHFAQSLTASQKKLHSRLRQLLLRAVYDSSLESTVRLIASELLTQYLDDGERSFASEIAKRLDMFPTELATMIWKRAILPHRNKNDNDQRRSSRSPSSSTIDRVGTDWFRHSTLLAGSSASFRHTMGGTGNCDASYSVLLELLKAKLPKETSFSVDIGDGAITQDVIQVGLFARGLQSFAGGEDGDEAEPETSENEIPGSGSESDDSTMAGMTLRVLGNQLRPFLFFRSTSELMSHMWSGAASEPTPVFRANLLVADYLEIRPLISGFLVEQSLKGMMSLDMTGEVQVSLWNRNSHSDVQTRAAMLFQGAQEIFTTDRRTSARKYFSFGGDTQFNFVTDFDFYNSPYQICIQITQPEFVFRHNMRKYEQIHSDDLHRRIHRRSYKIPAKSYVLNRDNNEMCAAMNVGEE